MGFLDALYKLGKTASLRDSANATPEWKELDDFLMMPLSLREERYANPFLVKIMLDVEDPMAKPLKVKGIKNIETAWFKIDRKSLQASRRQYLYKAPASANAPWSYSPVYTGLKNFNSKEIKDQINSLLKSEDWSKNKKSLLYKIHNKILRDLEEAGALAKGSVDIIMKQLVQHSHTLYNLCANKQRPCLIVFGCATPFGFLFPGEVPAFVSYFKQKLEERLTSNKAANCICCGKFTNQSAPLSDILKFSTFDKPGFAPGSFSQSKKAFAKASPICRDCYAKLSKAMEELNCRSSSLCSIGNITMDIVTEPPFSPTTIVSEFVGNILPKERNIYDRYTRKNDNLMFHIFFWEKNQDQIMVHLLINDIHPSIMKKLQSLWEETVNQFPLYSRNFHGKPNIYNAVTTIMELYMALAGFESDKEKQKSYLNKSLEIIKNLLQEEVIDTTDLINKIVCFLPNIYSSDYWRSLHYAGEELLTLKNRMMIVWEFLEKVNQSRRCIL
ncbi:TM1802 family CRISPR-associated protein [Thermovirga lienii]|uniref:TM1802 family CRISPR-associated protein n=1 Tax=Thermovirga lienii TaxID=336261 RepID=UPI002FE3C75E